MFFIYCDGGQRLQMATCLNYTFGVSKGLLHVGCKSFLMEIKYYG